VSDARVTLADSDGDAKQERAKIHLQDRKEVAALREQLEDLARMRSTEKAELSAGAQVCETLFQNLPLPSR
jgi:hypothetical protein